VDYLHYKVRRDLLVEWLSLLAEKSGFVEFFQDALVLAQHSDLTDEEKSVINTLHNLYLAEISGKIIPPIQLEELYLNVVRGRYV